MSKTRYVINSGAIPEISPTSRYYFLPNSSGYFLTDGQLPGEGLGVINYVGYGLLRIYHDGHPITFPKIREGSGGLKISGTGLGDGSTSFYNSTFSSTALVNVKSYIAGPAFIENSPSSRYAQLPGLSGGYVTEGLSGGGEGCIGSGTLKIHFDATGWVFPKTREGTGGLKISGGDPGTRWYTDLDSSTVPYTFTYLPNSEFFGQSTLRSASFVLPGTGLFTSEDIEGPSGLWLSGTGSYYQVSKFTYTVLNGGYILGGTTDPNSASNKPVQLPIISGGVLFGPDTDTETVWLRKFEYIGNGQAIYYGPNNIKEASAGIFDESYLRREVPGYNTYSGNGALFWAYDNYSKTPTGKNALICERAERKFGTSPYKFTWSARFKADSRLQHSLSTYTFILGAIVISEYPDFPPSYDYGSFVYFGVRSGSVAGTPIIVFSSQGSGNNQGFHWESITTSIPFDTEHRVVIHFDSTQAVSTNRIKVYLNGNLVTVNSGASTFPVLDSDGYSNLNWPTQDYYYHGIGNSYLSYYEYGYTRQFLGSIYESIFLDGLIKTDSELYSSSYSGPYNTVYSYHIKYLDPNDLGRDYSGNGIHFKDDLNLTSGTLYGDIIFEDLKSARTVITASFLNDKIFTYYSKFYLPSVTRSYGIFDQWHTGNEETLQTQALRCFDYSINNPIRFTVAARIWIDPRYDYVSDYNNEGDTLSILTLSATNNVGYDPFYTTQDQFRIYLQNKSNGVNFDSEYEGVSLHIEGWDFADVALRAPLISVGAYHRLVIQVNTALNEEADRIKVYLDGHRIDESNVLSRTFINWDVEPPQFYEKIPYPYQNEKLFNNWDDNSIPDNTAVCVGCTGYSPTSTPEWESFFGKLSEIILLDGVIKDPEDVLPLSGSYSGEYGGSGSFHYKFDVIGQDSGPNNYTLLDVGFTPVTNASVNENQNTAIFTIQDYDGYYRDITKYFKIGIGNNVQNYIDFKYVVSGSTLASGLSTTVVSTDTWHTLQINVDTSQITASNRIKIYLDENLLTYSGSPTYIAKDTLLYSGSGVFYKPYTVIGDVVDFDTSVESKAFKGKISNSIYLDGFNVATDFFNPLMPPIAYGGAGFKLDYLYPENLGYDSSPNNNSFESYNVLSDDNYESNYDFRFAIRFELFRDDTSIPDIVLPFRLVSAEITELVLVFDVQVAIETIYLPFKICGTGVDVTLELPLELKSVEALDAGTYSTTDSVTVSQETDLNLTYENLSSTVITDETDTINYLFGTSATDSNSVNGWIDITTGKLYVFDTATQTANGATDIIVDSDVIHAHYDYNLSLSNLIWQLTCSAGTLIGDISVEFEEDASTIAQFTLLPNSGVVDPLAYVGKNVTLDIAFSASDGNPYTSASGRVFTGIISEVEWDADLRVINVTADSQMPGYFNKLTREEIEDVIGGIWSDQVWNNEDDATGWTYAQERLSTTENIIWHDRTGNLRINSFKAGSVDVTYTDDERFHETLKLEFAQRSEMINQIRIDLDYKYPRRRERKIKFSWDDPSGGNIQTFLCNGGSYQLCQRSMVQGAAEGSDWVPISRITYDPIWPAQVVHCGGGIYDFIIWGMSVNNIYTPFKTTDGSWNPYVMVNVDTGSTKRTDNTVYSETTTGESGTTTTYYEGYTPDPSTAAGYETMTPESVTSQLCIGAYWSAARRWIQDVTEYYEIVMQCQDSINSIGVIATSESYSIDSGIEDTEWEKSLIPYQYTKPSGSLKIPGTDDSYWNGDEVTGNPDVVGREDFETAQEVIMAAAKVDILKAHRMTTVSFQVPFQLGLDLSKTVNVNTPYLKATGKVRKLIHTFSIDSGEASTEVNLAISRHNGSGLYTDDTLTPLERPEPSEESEIDTYIKLDNYVGGRVYGKIGFTGKWEDQDPEGIKDEDTGEWIKEPWNGFMTNYEAPLTNAEYASWMTIPSELVVEAAYKAATDVAPYTIPYQFTVRGPDINEEHTTANTAQAGQTINVNVPVDYLELFS